VVSALIPELNLDCLAAKYAQIIGNDVGEPADFKKLDAVSTTALGVLQEKGVYAFFLYLLARKKSEDAKIANILVYQLLNALKEKPFDAIDINYPVDLKRNSVDKQINQILDQVVKKIASNISTSILVADFYEQVLIYTRHLAKARSKAKE